MSQTLPEHAPAGHDEPTWRATPERGSMPLLRFMVWVAVRLGRRVARLLLGPIVLYFFVATPRARRSSRVYLARVLGRRPTALDLLRHLYTFSATIVDRVYFLLGRFNEFDVRTFGTEPLREALARGGCVLMGSHLGSFEALRACGRNEGRYEIVMLMDEVNARRIGEVLAALNPQAARGVINVGDAASILKAKERLDAGALVGVLGDRLRPGDRPLACEFLGAPAWLPNRPLALASVLKAPVFLGFGLYRGGNRYDVHFEQLSGPLDYPRRERAQMLGAIARQYAARLEHYARLAPYNWFNFYDFWERPPTRK